MVVSHAPQNSVSSAVSRDPNMHRRRASTLRSVMRKLFSRKHHSQGGDLAEDERESDPRTTSSRPPAAVRPESPPAPIVEARSRARRSRSLPSQDISFPQDPVTNKTKLSAKETNPIDSQPPLNDDNLRPEPPDHRRPRRRATLPSIVLSGEEARELVTRVARQATRASRVESAAVDDRSSEDTVVKRRRRRSRSANELRKVANAHRMSPIQWRRYSDAAKPGRARSPAPSAGGFSSSRPETRSTVHRGGEEGEGEEADEVSPGSHGPGPETESENGYDFGTLMGTMQDNSDTGLAQRVATLEVKLMDLELAIAKLQSQDVPAFHPNELDDHTPEQQPHPDDTEGGELQPPPPIRDPSFLFTSIHSTPVVTPPRSSPAADANRESGVTVRPQTSGLRPSSSHDSEFRGISVEQYSALTTLVRREQTARKLLESQMTQLRKDMEQLREGDQDRRPRPPDPGSFYHPSSPESLDGGGTSSTQQRKSERERGFSTTKSRKWKDDFETNRSDPHFFAPSVSNSSLSTGSDRAMYRKRSTPDAAVNPSQIPGMI